MAKKDSGWWQGWAHEPARLYAFIAAAIQVAVAFGLDLTPEQQNAILGLAALTLGAGEMIRSKVVPEVKVKERQRRGGAPRMAGNPGERG